MAFHTTAPAAAAGTAWERVRSEHTPWFNCNVGEVYPSPND